jgi:hypothetical protein
MRIILYIVIFFCFILYPMYTSGGPYLDSAHGNSTYGVKRSATGFPTDYANGNCAHCHEQHASINGTEPAPDSGSPSNYAIFANNFTSQSDDFCFYCHKGMGSLQFSFDRTNYNYSYWFGGDHVNHTSPNNIYDAFNPASGSSHNLDDIYNFITGLSGSHPNFPNFPSDSNPCDACHNPHLSKRSYPIVRPTDRNNIWGDSAGEHMSDFAAAHGGNYQAPCQYPQTSCNPVTGPFEPDGSSIIDGSNLPDYATFCSDCHNATNDVWSTTLGRYLQKIGWAQQARTYCQSPGDYHGSITRCFDVMSMIGQVCGTGGDWGSIKDPYYTDYKANFILNCTDCHEPHGAVNGYNTTVPFLLRKTVNGHYNGWPPGPGPWTWERDFCMSCHDHTNHCGNYGGCMTWTGVGLGCHTHNWCAKCYGCWWCGSGGLGGHTF